MIHRLSALVLLLASCAVIPWQEVEGEYRSKEDEYVVVLPQGWMRANRQDFTLVTRDGALLQNILIIRHKIGEPLPLSKKALSEQMTIQEVADVLFESFQADQNVLDCELLEKRPSDLGGIAGLRIDFTFKNRDELPMRSVAYGCISESWLYVMRYTAASRYYFERDLPVFEKAVATFRVL